MITHVIIIIILVIQFTKQHKCYTETLILDHYELKDTLYHFFFKHSIS